MWKECQKKVPTTEEGPKKVKRNSKEGADNRRRSKEGQKNFPTTEEGQKKVKRRSKEGQKKVRQQIVESCL